MRVLYFTVLLLLAACGDSDQPAADSSVAATPRLVTLAPHLAELVFAAGAGDYLVGVSAYSDYPEAASELPIVSDGFSLNAEALLAVRPTMILAWQGGGQSRMVALAESLGVPLVQIPGERLDDIASALQTIGTLADTSAVAEQAAFDFERALSDLEPASQPMTVFYQIGQQPLYTIGGGHFISDVITRCGGTNLFEDLGDAAPVVSLEAVIARDPDVILTSAGSTTEVTELWSRWPSMQAVVNNRILGVPADELTRPGPRLADGAAAVCARLRSAMRLDQPASP